MLVIVNWDSINQIDEAIHCVSLHANNYKDTFYCKYGTP